MAREKLTKAQAVAFEKLKRGTDPRTINSRTLDALARKGYLEYKGKAAPTRHRAPQRREEYKPASTSENERLVNHIARQLRSKTVNIRHIRQNVERMSPDAKEFARNADSSDIVYQASRRGGQYVDDDTGDNLFWYH